MKLSFSVLQLMRHQLYFPDSAPTCHYLEIKYSDAKNCTNDVESSSSC